MSLILYHFPLFPNAVKVRSVLHHLGLDYEQRIVNLLEGGTRKPEYLAVNPNGLIPTLQDGDLVL